MAMAIGVSMPTAVSSRATRRGKTATRYKTQRATPSKSRPNAGFPNKAARYRRRKNKSAGKHHRLHHTQTGHGQSDDKLFCVPSAPALRFLRIIRRSSITGLADFQQNVRQFDVGAVPHHAAAVGAVIQIHAHYALHAQQLLLNQPRTRRR